MAETYSNRSLVYIRLGQYESAVSDCNSAIELKPDLAVAYNNCGVAYSAMQRIEEAISDFKRALELNPKLKSAKDSLKRMAAGKKA